MDYKTTTHEPPLILASASPYRAQLLARLGVTFASREPAIDASQQPGEAAAAYVQRLADAKAAAVAQSLNGDGLVIGSDQVSVNNGELLGKPHTQARAVEQLLAASAQSVVFYTAVAMHQRARSRTITSLVTDRVDFRPLTEDEVTRYVAREQPLDCAGGFRAEGLGISLFRAVHTRDPTALVGLPLIGVADMLREFGLSVP